eukprot:XP_011666197.1 PREDICTED: uncharacterized protein LOC105439187 [Strongylocentrotus purpuratus]
MAKLVHTPFKANLKRPHDVVVHNGKYVIADTYNNRVVAIDPTNSGMSVLWSQPKFLPYSLIALSDTEDHFLITDVGKQSKGCVYELRNGTLTQWAKDYSLFKNPTGIAMRNKQVYVADWGNDCIHVFEISGKYIRKMEECSLERPWFLAFNSKDQLHVAGYNAVHIFDVDGNCKKLNISTGKRVWHYRGIAIDDDDNIFITARSDDSRLFFTHETLTVLNEDHRPLGDITRGWTQFNYLRGLCIDRKNDAVVVVDGEWHRLQSVSYHLFMHTNM